MISVDTNILVRIFVNDESDHNQIEKARQTVKNHGRIYVSHIVLVETVWVLKSLYSFPKKQIVETLEHLVNNQAFVLESETLCRDALILYCGTNLSFSDAMIFVNSRQKGYSLLTFDKKLLKLDGAVGVG